MGNKKSYIVPFEKRNKIGFALAAVAALLFGAAMLIVWWAVSLGAHDVYSMIVAFAITIGFGCSLTAAITGHLEWILLGPWWSY